MSEPSLGQMSDLDTHYLGEPAPRRPWLAFGLACLAPGLGWAYLGRVGTAVVLNVFSVLLWVGFALVWSSMKFFPAIPFFVFGSLWLVLVVMVALDARQYAVAVGGHYVLRDGNHPFVYAAVALLSFWLPMSGLTYATGTALWGFVEVHDRAMYPAVISGDVLLIDRADARRGDLSHGQIVVYRVENGLRVGRLAALAGEEIALVDGVPFVNDRPRVQAPMYPAGADELASLSGAPVEGTKVVVESVGALHYAVVQPRVAYWDAPETWRVEEGHVFVLNDDRTRRNDSRSFGPIPESDVIGIARHIAYHNDAHAEIVREAETTSFFRGCVAWIRHRGDPRTAKRIQVIDSR